MSKTGVLKIAAPALIAAFILAANVVYKISSKEGTVSLLADGAYPAAFIKDAAQAKKSIKCAMYMFKLDGYMEGRTDEPVPVMAAAMASAAKRGVDTAIVLEMGEDGEITTKYNKSTAKYLEENGIRVVFDGPEKRLHTKMCVIDEKIIYIGSHNYTSSAMKRNSEASVRIVSEELATDAEEYLAALGL